LPSSWHRFAVDYDGDGYKNIWRSLPDSFASIANYLKQNGWKPNEPWAIGVKVPENLDHHLLSLNVTKTIALWERLGVRTLHGEAFPNGHLQAAIIKPDGGPTMMVFNNFNVIMQWNHSTYYAGTVGYMADAICQIP
jgi:membrane-bound lytic murein transglycosylase B